MAILSSALSDAESSFDDQYVRRYRRSFRIISDVGDDEHFVLKNCGWNPRDPHPTAPNAFILGVSIKIEPRKTRGTFGGVKKPVRLWNGTVDYGPFSPLDFGPGNNPLLKPKSFRLEPFIKLVPAFVDIDGKPILNSVGDPYDPPLMDERLCGTLTVNRNEASPNLFALLSLANKINADPWLGFPAYTVKIAPIKLPERVYDQESGVLYYPMEYSFEIDLDGWHRKVVNAGLRCLDANGSPVKIYDANGTEATTPSLLDADGHVITDPDETNIVIDEYKLNHETDFSVLNMDDLFTS